MEIASLYTMLQFCMRLRGESVIGKMEGKQISLVSTYLCISPCASSKASISSRLASSKACIDVFAAWRPKTRDLSGDEPVEEVGVGVAVLPSFSALALTTFVSALPSSMFVS